MDEIEGLFPVPLLRARKLLDELAFVLLVLALMWAHRRLGASLPRWGNALPAYAIGTVASFWFLGRLARLLAA